MDFFKINSSFLNIEAVYTFNLFLFDEARDARIVALHANSEVTQENMDYWIKTERKGGYLQILRSEIDIFCKDTSTSVDDVKKINAFVLKMENLEKERESLYAKAIAENSFVFKTFISNVSNNNITELIKRVKSEVLLFPLSLSEEVSFTTELVQKIFNYDILPVKIASFAYMFAKLNKVEDPEVLSSIVLSSLFKDIGYNQINRNQFLKNIYHDNDLYKKHPMLSLFILAKSGFEFSKLTKRIILEHHELIDGSGFPRGKKEDYILMASFIVHISDQVILLSEGLIDGKKIDIVKAMNTISSEMPISNLAIKFPRNLMDNLKT